MRVYLASTKLHRTAWDHQPCSTKATYYCHYARSGDDMRSHASLYFTDIPYDMRQQGLQHCSEATFDFLSDGTIGFTDFKDKHKWYGICHTSFIDLYKCGAIPEYYQDQFARIVYSTALDMCECGLDYRKEWRWNATLAPCYPYPCFSLDGRPPEERGSNCVGVTIKVLRDAYQEFCSCPLELTRGYNEAYLPEHIHLAMPKLGCVHISRLNFGHVDGRGTILTRLIICPNYTMSR